MTLSLGCDRILAFLTDLIVGVIMLHTYVISYVVIMFAGLLKWPPFPFDIVPAP